MVTSWTSDDAHSCAFRDFVSQAVSISGPGCQKLIIKSLTRLETTIVSLPEKIMPHANVSLLDYEATNNHLYVLPIAIEGLVLQGHLQWS